MSWRLKALASVALSYAIVFGFVAFINAELNPWAWDGAARLVVCVLGTLGIFPIADAVRSFTEPSQ